MKHLGRWSLAASVVAVSVGVSLLAPTGRAPPLISRQSTAIDRPAVDSKDRAIPVPRTHAISVRNSEQAQQHDWETQFRAVGTNYFEFIRRAAQAAYDGDSAAQYYVGRALARCEETNALYQDADDADQAVSHLAFVPALL